MRSLLTNAHSANEDLQITFKCFGWAPILAPLSTLKQIKGPNKIRVDIVFTSNILFFLHWNGPMPKCSPGFEISQTTSLLKKLETQMVVDSGQDSMILATVYKNRPQNVLSTVE